MTGRLEGRLIGLGVCGSIAAYKAVELVRLLRAEGADVEPFPDDEAIGLFDLEPVDGTLADGEGAGTRP